MTTIFTKENIFRIQRNPGRFAAPVAGGIGRGGRLNYAGTGAATSVSGRGMNKSATGNRELSGKGETMNRTVHVSLLVTMLAVSAVSFGGTYGGGLGTEVDPYQIGTAAHWQELMNTSADWGKQFVLTADIDLLEVSLVPVGTRPQPFTAMTMSSTM
jgi:hypothetical protein